MLIDSCSSFILDASSSGCRIMGRDGRPLQTGLSLPLRCAEPSRVCWWSDTASLQAMADDETNGLLTYTWLMRWCRFGDACVED
jgi:hypothetical protein